MSESAIAMQLKWGQIQLSVQAAGIGYSPDLVNDLFTQANRGWRQMLADTSQYEEIEDHSEVEGYLNSAIGTLESLLSDAEDDCDCEECAYESEEEE